MSNTATSRYLLVAIIDKKARDIMGGEGAITMYRTPEQAIRMFDDVARNPNTIIARHPEDFDLVQVGHIVISSDDTATITDLDDQHLIIMTGTTWLTMKNEADNRKSNGGF